MWFLVLGSACVLTALVLFGCLYASVPHGWSPRIGSERDVTALFPGFWRISRLSSDPSQFTLRAQVVLGGLWAAYLVILMSVYELRGADRVRASRIVAIVIIIAHAILLLAPPAMSGDLFQYALFGRMVSHYHLNPYITSAAQISSDPISPYASWNFLTTHFGPGFTWLSAAVTTLAGGDVFLTGVAFKALMSVTTLASCWFVRDISTRLSADDGLSALAIYGLNPTVLIETAAMGHNEAVVVFYALAGIALALRGHPMVGFCLLLLSADVKMTSASIALLFAVQLVFRSEGANARVRRAAGLIALSLGIALVLWAPFWHGAQVFAVVRGIMTQGAGLAPGAKAQAIGSLRLVSFAAMIFGCAIAASRTSIGGVLTLASSIGLVFLLFIYPWSFAWYVIPPLAFAVVAPRTAPNLVVLVFNIAFGFVYTLTQTHLHALR